MAISNVKSAGAVGGNGGGRWRSAVFIVDAGGEIGGAGGGVAVGESGQQAAKALAGDGGNRAGGVSGSGSVGGLDGKAGADCISAAAVGGVIADGQRAIGFSDSLAEERGDGDLVAAIVGRIGRESRRLIGERANGVCGGKIAGTRVSAGGVIEPADDYVVLRLPLDGG